MMATCPNGDPNFNSVLQTLVGDSKPSTRQSIYYGVCIPVRLALYVFILYFHNYWAVPYIVGLASLVAFFNLLPSFWKVTAQTQWWSKRFQAVMSMLILIISILVILKKVNSIYIPTFLFISLFGGLLQNFLNQIC